jgi:hypothetical protein
MARGEEESWIERRVEASQYPSPGRSGAADQGLQPTSAAVASTLSALI